MTESTEYSLSAEISSNLRSSGNFAVSITFSSFHVLKHAQTIGKLKESFRHRVRADLVDFVVLALLA